MDWAICGLGTRAVPSRRLLLSELLVPFSEPIEANLPSTRSSLAWMYGLASVRTCAPPALRPVSSVAVAEVLPMLLGTDDLHLDPRGHAHLHVVAKVIVAERLPLDVQLAGGAVDETG